MNRGVSVNASKLTVAPGRSCLRPLNPSSRWAMRSGDLPAGVRGSKSGDSDGDVGCTIAHAAGANPATSAAPAGQAITRLLPETDTFMAGYSTTVLTEAVLLPLSGSVTPEPAVAVFVNVAAAFGWTTMLALATAPAPKLPRFVNVTTLPASV